MRHRSLAAALFALSAAVIIAAAGTYVALKIRGIYYPKVRPFFVSYDVGVEGDFSDWDLHLTMSLAPGTYVFSVVFVPASPLSQDALAKGTAHFTVSQQDKCLGDSGATIEADGHELALKLQEYEDWQSVVRASASDMVLPWPWTNVRPDEASRAVWHLYPMVHLPRTQYPYDVYLRLDLAEWRGIHGQWQFRIEAYIDAI